MPSITIPVQPPRKGYLPTLDGWRAIAIGFVLLQHAAESANYSGNRFIAPLLSKGTFGVQIFFAISGYLITSRLLTEEQATGTVSLRNFYKRRVFRIYPAALVFIFCLGILRIFNCIYLPTKHVIAAVGGFANYVDYIFPGAWTWYLGHFWSLAVEEHFYLLWPGILFAFGSRRAIYVALFLALAIAVWRAAGPALGIQTVNADFYQRTDICADGLLWGCIAALAATRNATRPLLQKLAKPLPWCLILGIVIWFEFFSPGGHWWWIGGVALAMGMALLVAGTVAQPTWPVSRVLENPAMRWIGRISYSLYLWQQLFLASGNFRSHRLALVQRFPLSLVCAFGFALLSYHFVERPLIHLGHRLTKTKIPPSIA